MKGSTIKNQHWQSRQWYDRNPDRLQEEKAVMENKFPRFTLNQTNESFLFWKGPLWSNENNRYVVSLKYPKRYPYSPPKPYILDPDVRDYNPPHIYKKGELCVFEQSDQVWQDNSTAATMAGLVGAWINAFEYWRKTGEWPGPEAD